jgi:ABC-type polysaccharide/polyol phosphate transport system ATPase subunit
MSCLIVEDVSLEFPLYGSNRSLRKDLFKRAGSMIKSDDRHQNRIVVKALNGISLDLREGDRLGLVGHNGAGKSTLLKAMAGIYEPLTGRVLCEGVITPLLDSMPGLDAENTGYESIAMAGMLLGMSQKEIARKIPDIEQFCELGEYLSLPIRSYSSGMQTRLAFAVATALEPGILLMDEGIGAGDARFTERAARRMDEFVGRSRIVVLASHSDDLIRRICNKAALMDGGRLVEIGDVDTVIANYHRFSAAAE